MWIFMLLTLLTGIITSYTVFILVSAYKFAVEIESDIEHILSFRYLVQIETWTIF